MADRKVESVLKSYHNRKGQQEREGRVLGTIEIEEDNIRTESNITEYDIPAEALQTFGIDVENDITIEVYTIPDTSIKQIKVIER